MQNNHLTEEESMMALESYSLGVNSTFNLPPTSGT